MINRNENVDYMTKYLKCAFEFEKYVYLWENALNSANSKLKTVKQSQNQASSECTEAASNLASLESDYERLENIRNGKKKALRRKAILVPAIGILVLAVISVIFTFAFNSGDTASLQDYIAAFLVVLVEFGSIVFLVSLFFLIRYIIFNANNKSSELQVSKKRTGAYEEQRHRNNSIKLRELSAKEKCIKKDQHDIIENLKRARNDRDKLYAMNMLPLKYRNLVAAATLYEYLSTGRCTQIKGHGGIYDTFEHDMQNGMIISELRQIKAIGYRVLDNQEILCSELQRTNRSLKNIESGLDRIETVNSQIASNTAISAAANVQTAASAKYMADLMYYNH